MGYLIAALAAPLAGPVLYGLLHDQPRAVRLVDGFVYLAVPALVAWQVLPFAWRERSLFVFAALAGGMLIPVLAERASKVPHRHTDDVALLVGLSGLALHALLEGAALIAGEASVGTAFALALVLHRIPVGLVIWWLVRPRHGIALASSGVGAIVVATLVGYGLGIGGDVPGAGSELYQAFVAGSLVHVVFHQGRHDHTHEH